MRRILISFVATFAVALPVFVLAARGGSPPAALRGGRPPCRPRRRPTRPRTSASASLQATVRAAPKRADGWTLLAGAYLQKVRETGDAGFYARAQGAVDARSHAAPRRPRRADPAQRARALAPRLRGRAARRAARPHPGARGGPAVRRRGRRPRRARALPAGPSGRCRTWSIASPTSPPTRACPTSASCTAISTAPLAAMRAAVSAGGAVPEQDAYVRALLGGLELQKGRIGAAVRQYREALQAVPGYPAAEAGLAQADVARGRLAPGHRPAAARRRPAAAAELRHRAGRGAGGRGPARGGGADLRARARRDDAPAARRRQRRRRARPLRGRPRQPAPGRGSRPPSLGGGAERSLGRRPGVGPAPRRALARRARVGAARAGPRLARPGLPHARGAHRAQRRRAAPGGAPGWRGRAPVAPRSARACGRRCDEARAAARRCAGAPRPLAAPAGAHPLGNFSVNHLTVVRASSDRVDLRYVLDQAEIPTFRERGLSPAQVLARKRAEVARGVTPDRRRPARGADAAPGRAHHLPAGRRAACTPRASRCCSSARVAPRGAVVVRDATFGGRVGWRAVLAEPGRGTAVRSDVTSADPTRRLRVYPTALLASPANRTVAHLRVSPGSGTVTAPRGDGGAGTTTTDRGAGDRFGSVFERAAAGQGVLLLLLLAAFGWGAVHALSPGHGKAMVAAYLVGTRGTARHAVALGLTVTVTHTIGVFALGAVALALSAYVLPEDLYPWLNLVSGLLVLGVGASVVRSRVRRARAPDHRARPRPRPRSRPRPWPRPWPRPRRTTTTTVTTAAMATTTTPTCARARCWRWGPPPGSSRARRRSSCSSARWPSTRSALAWSSSSPSPPAWRRP